MPTLYNPSTHLIATANNRIVPSDYPVYVTNDWDCGYRARRIDDLLTSKAKLSVSDIEQIQNDVYSIPASQLVPAFIQAGQAAGGDAAKAAGLLQNWDFTMTRNSTAAAVYEVAAGTLLRETVEPLLGKDLYGIFQSNATPSCLFTTLVNSLSHPAPLFASDQARDAAIGKALADTVHYTPRAVWRRHRQVAVGRAAHCPLRASAGNRQPAQPDLRRCACGASRRQHDHRRRRRRSFQRRPGKL